MAQVPLAKMSCGVSGLPEYCSDIWHVRLQPVIHASAGIDFVIRVMPVNFVPGRVMPGHERATTGRTDRAVHIKLSEQGSFLGQSIQVGCLQLSITVATQITPAEIIREYENKV